MPRLHPRTLHHARKIDLLLPLVLQATRDLSSGKNELRWLKEHIAAQHGVHTNLWTQKLRKACHDRSRGKPLQYILGSEYFGDLEIECRKGVLIPRQETATSVTHLISRLHQSKAALPKHMKILDLCTGTGCIPLLTYYEFCNKYRRDAKDMEVVGVDISPTALALANKNLQKLIGEGMIPPKANLQFLQADILASKDEEVGNGVKSLMTELKQHTSTSTSETNPGNGNWDILISNPPYISPSAFNHTTTRSVKKYEPRLALVPPPIQSPTTASLHPKSLTTQHFNPYSLNPDQDQDQGDLFYPHLLTIATTISAKVILFEVADLEQAKRVAEMARRQGSWDGVEIWRDDPVGYSDEDGNRRDDGEDFGEGDGEGERELMMMKTETETESGIKLLGRGNGRTVVAYREEGKDWMCVRA